MITNFKTYTITNPPDLNDLKTRLKIKRSFESESDFLNFVTNLNFKEFGEEINYLEDHEIEILRKFGATVEEAIAPCDCGYCRECDERKKQEYLSKLTKEERDKIAELEKRRIQIQSEVDCMSEEARRLWGRMTSFAPCA